MSNYNTVTEHFPPSSCTSLDPQHHVVKSHIAWEPPVSAPTEAGCEEVDAAMMFGQAGPPSAGHLEELGIPVWQTATQHVSPALTDSDSTWFSTALQPAARTRKRKRTKYNVRSVQVSALELCIPPKFRKGFLVSGGAENILQKRKIKAKVPRQVPPSEIRTSARLQNRASLAALDDMLLSGSSGQKKESAQEALADRNSAQKRRKTPTASEASVTPPSSQQSGLSTGLLVLSSNSLKVKLRHH